MIPPAIGMLTKRSLRYGSVRTSRRNIASQYYYRLLKSQNKRVVEDEMHKLTEPFGFIFSKQYLLNLEILIMVRISRGVKLFTNWNRLICDCKRLLYLQNQNHLNTKAMKYIFPCHYYLSLVAIVRIWLSIGSLRILKNIRNFFIVQKLTHILNLKRIHIGLKIFKMRWILCLMMPPIQNGLKHKDRSWKV